MAQQAQIAKTKLITEQTSYTLQTKDSNKVTKEGPVNPLLSLNLDLDLTL